MINGYCRLVAISRVITTEALRDGEGSGSGSLFPWPKEPELMNDWPARPND